MAEALTEQEKRYRREKLLDHFQLPALLSAVILYVLFTRFSPLGLAFALTGIGFMFLCRFLAAKKTADKDQDYVGSDAWRCMGPDLLFTLLAIAGIFSRDYIPFLTTVLLENLETGEDVNSIGTRIVFLLLGTAAGGLFPLFPKKKDTYGDKPVTIVWRWLALAAFFTGLLQFFFKDWWVALSPPFLAVFAVSLALAIWRAANLYPVKWTAWLAGAAGLALLLLKLFAPGYRLLDYNLEGFINLQLFPWYNILAAGAALGALWWFDQVYLSVYTGYGTLYAAAFGAVALLKCWAWFRFEFGWFVLLAYAVFAVVMFAKVARKPEIYVEDDWTIATLAVAAGLMLLQITAYYGSFLFGALLLAALFTAFVCIKGIFDPTDDTSWGAHAFKWQLTLLAAGAALFPLATQRGWSPMKLWLFLGILVVSGAVVWMLNFRHEITHNKALYRPASAAVCAVACGLFLLVALKGGPKIKIEPAEADVYAGAAKTGDSVLLVAAEEPEDVILSYAWFEGWATDKSLAVAMEGGAATLEPQEGRLVIWAKAQGGLTRCERWYYDTAREVPEYFPLSVKFSRKSVTLGLGESYIPKWTVEGGADYSKLYAAEDSAAVWVYANRIYAEEPGTAAVTLRTFNGLEASMAVTVKKEPTKVAFSKTALSLKKGSSETLEYTLSKGSASNAIRIWSDDPGIAKIDAKTLEVTAVKKGTCTLHIETFNGKKGKCEVTVK